MCAFVRIVYTLETVIASIITETQVNSIFFGFVFRLYLISQIFPHNYVNNICLVRYFNINYLNGQ